MLLLMDPGEMYYDYTMTMYITLHYTDIQIVTLR